MFFVAAGWASDLRCSRIEDLDNSGGGEGGGLTEYLSSCNPEDVLPVVLLPSSWLRFAWTTTTSRKEGDLADGKDGGTPTECLGGCMLEDMFPVGLLPGSWLSGDPTPTIYNNNYKY